MFRIDLRLPEDFDNADSKVITRFFKALNAKLDVDIK
ncbi:inovirus-type Gp2 protein [Vibrio splendidus]